MTITAVAYLVNLVTHEGLASEYEQRMSSFTRSSKQTGHHSVILKDFFLTLHCLFYNGPAGLDNSLLVFV